MEQRPIKFHAFHNGVSYEEVSQIDWYLETVTVYLESGFVGVVE